MRRRSCNWEELSQFCEALLSPVREQPSKSMAYAELNTLFQMVECYLLDKGFVADAEGHWPKDHPSYPLVYQLAEAIEACKEAAQALPDPRLSCFLWEILLPELYQQWEQAGAASA